MNINIVSPIGYTGYGVAGFNLVKALTIAGHQISLFPIGSPNITNQQDAELVKTCLKNAQTFDVNAPCIRIWHQWEMSLFAGKGKHIGYPFFELDRLNALEIHQLGQCDEIWVASQWAKDIVARDLYNHYKWPNCESLVKVVPLGVDREIFNEQPTTTTKPENYPFVFLNIGKFEIRKSHDILVKVFNKAFTPADYVELWIAPHNPFLSAQETADWEKMYINSTMGKAGCIKIIPRQNTSYDIANIMKAADCGVFISRAEGFNLENLEMLACGKPVISTFYSAHTEYLQYGIENNSVNLIPIDKMVPAFDGRWFFGKDGEWAEPNFDSIVKAMKSRYEVGRRSVNQEAIDISKRFTWELSAQKIISLL